MDVGCTKIGDTKMEKHKLDCKILFIKLKSDGSKIKSIKKI
jgi:hypothetical protein